MSIWPVFAYSGNGGVVQDRGTRAVVVNHAELLHCIRLINACRARSRVWRGSRMETQDRAHDDGGGEKGNEQRSYLHVPARFSIDHAERPPDQIHILHPPGSRVQKVRNVGGHERVQRRGAVFLNEQRVETWWRRRLSELRSGRKQSTYVERGTGIGPASEAWEASVLPLY
jgi:hypothetical protein